MPVLAASVTVANAHDEDGARMWRVVVVLPDGTSLQRDYLRWDQEHGPTGFLSHEAALDLLGIALTS